MRKNLTLLVILLMTISVCLTAYSQSKVQTHKVQGERAPIVDKPLLHRITDMAGRQVEVPTKVNEVYSTGQPGVVMLYTINPKKLLGWCMKLSDDEAEYINPKYLSLPVLGLMQGGNNTASREEIMGRTPDVILLMSVIDEAQISAAEEIQAVTQVPVVIADFSLENLPKTYKFLGEVLGEEKRCEVLADYCQKVINEEKENAAKIPSHEVLNIYYAQGSKGLQTAPKSSSHSEVINLVGGNNIVQLEDVSDGRLKVNMEQVLLWDPDVILVADGMGHASDEAGKASLLSNQEDSWHLVKAAQNKMVFDIPKYPFNWLDMPPSVNRMIGIKWLGNLLYPKYFNYDMREEIKKYYLLFYQRELTEEEITKLLAHAIRNN